MQRGAKTCLPSIKRDRRFKEKPAYKTVAKNPGKFKYLTEPKDYLKIVKALNKLSGLESKT